MSAQTTAQDSCGTVVVRLKSGDVDEYPSCSYRETRGGYIVVVEHTTARKSGMPVQRPVRTISGDAVAWCGYRAELPDETEPAATGVSSESGTGVPAHP